MRILNIPVEKWLDLFSQIFDFRPRGSVGALPELNGAINNKIIGSTHETGIAVHQGCAHTVVSNPQALSRVLTLNDLGSFRGTITIK